MAKTIPAFPSIPIAGGTGAVAAWARPDLLVCAPSGVGIATPAHTVLSAGATIAAAASQDINFESQRNSALAAKGGLSLFTYGKAGQSDKPNAETGMQLHAASGTVSVQAQANTLNFTADKSIAVSSVTDAITMGSPQHVLLTAGGASLRIASGNITLTATGPAQFLAAKKELTAGAGASAAVLDLPVASELGSPQPARYSQAVRVDESLLELWGDGAQYEVRLFSETTGELLHHASVSGDGASERVFTEGPEKLVAVIQRSDQKWDVLSTDAPPNQSMSADMDIAEFD